MNSRIFNTCVKVIFPIQVMLSIIILFRGHNLPGGGFIGGLVLAVALILKALTTKEKVMEPRIKPKYVMATGLLFSLCSGLIPFLFNETFLKGIWGTTSFLGFIPSTVFLFDLGVYLLVTGMVLQVVASLEQELHL